MIDHKGAEIPLLRYVYMIEADNNGQKSRFYGLTGCYYTGMTMNLKRRFLEHIHGWNSKFLSRNFPDSSKKLVYVGYVFGRECNAIEEEFRVKALSKTKKQELISSDKNKLIKYVPLKAIILKSFYDSDEQECIYL
jgi:predicted GIY-YIG superfamily endonuclease